MFFLLKYDINLVFRVYHSFSPHRNMNFIYRIKQIILLSGDAIAYAMAIIISLGLRQLAIPSITVIGLHVPLFLKLFVLWSIINYITGLYDLTRVGARDQYRRLVQAATMSLVISVVAFYLQGNSTVTPKTILVLSIAIGYSLSALWRLFYSKILAISRLKTRIIFVGFDQESRELISMIEEAPEKGYKVVAIFDPTKTVKNSDIPGVEVYSSLAAIRPAITTHKAHLVVTAPSYKDDPEIVRELYELLFWPVRLTGFSTVYENITGQVPGSSYSDSWFISNLVNLEHPAYEGVRRGFDYVAGIILGLALLVLFPLVALVIRLNSRGPIIFKQQRMGWRGQQFFLYKFRTMYALSADGSAEVKGAEFAQHNDTRVTAVGKFLRQTRLDELPQVLNLLRGDITLIGPRPERPEIVQKLEAVMPYYHLRLLVKPGITGWAAINQHYAGSVSEAIQKLQYDLYYIKNRSILLDCAILLRTINVMIRMMGR